jgi:hypothetical protein
VRQNRPVHALHLMQRQWTTIRRGLTSSNAAMPFIQASEYAFGCQEICGISMRVVRCECALISSDICRTQYRQSALSSSPNIANQPTTVRHNH